MRESGCKGCSASVRLKQSEVERILADYLRENPAPLVSDAIYAERLRLCRACSQLQYGTTCSHCGCLVQVMAKLKNKQCPSPRAPVW
jgi:hypothetical protein